jgi:tRNA-(ms[2]io[6]A)-hydroxylase
MTLSRLAREELRHFEQVHEHLEARSIEYTHLSPSRYAGGLKALVRSGEPRRLVDTLLMGAVVEARSCERFLGLTEVLPADLAGFYQRLLESEARHFEQYLSLAARYAEEPIEETLMALLEREAELITGTDTEFRFHSGPLAARGSVAQAR